MVVIRGQAITEGGNEMKDLKLAFADGWAWGRKHGCPTWGQASAMRESYDFDELTVFYEGCIDGSENDRYRLMLPELDNLCTCGNKEATTLERHDPHCNWRSNIEHRRMKLATNRAPTLLPGLDADNA